MFACICIRRRMIYTRFLPRLHLTHAQSQGGGDRGSGSLQRNQKAIGFLSNTGPDSDPLKIHKATKPTFNAEPSSECHLNGILMGADVGQIWAVFGLLLPHQLKRTPPPPPKKKLSDKTFWIHACYRYSWYNNVMILDNFRLCTEGPVMFQFRTKDVILHFNNICLILCTLGSN